MKQRKGFTIEAGRKRPPVLITRSMSPNVPGVAKSIQFFYGFSMDNNCFIAFYHKLKILNLIIMRINKSIRGK